MTDVASDFSPAFRQDSALRQEDLLVADIQDLLLRSSLPALRQPFSPYIQKLVQAGVALRSGQHVGYLDNAAFVDNIQEFCENAWTLTQKIQQPLLEPLELAHARSEMKTAVALTRAGMTAALKTEGIFQSTMALLQHEKAAYASYPVQTMFEAQRAQLEYMQMSPAQLAHVATLGINLFASLRELHAQNESQAPLQLSFLDLSDSMTGARDPKMQALASCTVQLCCEEWLSDEQFLRMQSKDPSSPIIPNLYPLLLVLVDTCLKPRAAHSLTPDMLESSLHESSLRHVRHRERSRSPAAHHRNSLIETEQPTAQYPAVVHYSTALSISSCPGF
ncbi:hypothetical protein WJX73_006853 [Symbiochloris irregularis]|uniref:Uncharacterized protein n=1 Tax=Symbiochloris irregularis TaxID=706552 RepID=A0AAW1NQR8_9CHLO